MTSNGDDEVLPLDKEWNERRRGILKSIAFFALAEQLMGGREKMSQALSSGDWVPVQVAQFIANSARERATAELGFYKAIELAHPESKIRIVLEGSAPNAPYTFVVDVPIAGGQHASHWYKFAPPTNEDIMPMINDIGGDLINFVPAAAKPAARPRRPIVKKRK